MNLLEQAIQLAVRAHTGQMDEDGMPHIVHCFEVFRRVQAMFDNQSAPPPKLKKYTQEEIEIAAILHDTVEDTWVTLDMIRSGVLRGSAGDLHVDCFGENVAEIVDSVTRRGLGEGETKEFYRDYVYRAKENEGGVLVKIADLGHNRSRTYKIKKASWKNKLEFKYRTAHAVLNYENQPTWEQASASVQYVDGNPHFYIADPNGKKIEITEEEYADLMTKPGSNA